MNFFEENQNENQNERNYLLPENQENDMPGDNVNPQNENYEECNDDSTNFILDNNNGNTFPYQRDLFNSIMEMKNKIYHDFFQSGSAAKVHDPSILNKYVDLIGNVWKSIKLNQSLDLSSESDSVKKAITDFLEELDKHLRDESNNYETNEMRTRFLKLHLHCYPYCLNNDCLLTD